VAALLARGPVRPRGLAGLIAWPAAEAGFRATVIGAARPPWTPHAHPRLDALVVGFALLLDADPVSGELAEGAAR
jgi:hypothetical protein